MCRFKNMVFCFNHIRRQNKTWYSATILPLDDWPTIDIVQVFSQVPTLDIEERAKAIWDSLTINIGHHTKGTPAYDSRLFRVFLMNSLPNEFLTMLYSPMLHATCL
jgi:hypothetical protein